KNRLYSTQRRRQCFRPARITLNHPWSRSKHPLRWMTRGCDNLLAFGDQLVHGFAPDISRRTRNQDHRKPPIGRRSLEHIAAPRFTIQLLITHWYRAAGEPPPNAATCPDCAARRAPE